jgi:hypothetical protein
VGIYEFAMHKILAQALSHRGQQNSLELRYELMEPILTMQHQTKADFIKDENRALNAIKRMKPPVTLDPEEAAYSMIVRACHNSHLLGLPRIAKAGLDFTNLKV